MGLAVALPQWSSECIINKLLLIIFGITLGFSTLDTNSDKIHLTLSIYDPAGTYSKYAGACIASICSNTTRKLCLHVFHDDTLEETNRSKLTAVVQKFDKEIEFINIKDEILECNVDLDDLSGTFTRGALFRLFVPDFLLLSKVIYLDTDIICSMDIGELWDLPISGDKALSGTSDLPDGDITYINSGVLVMNLDVIRKHGRLIDLACDYLTTHKGLLYPDQDFLNDEFKNEKMILPKCFNDDTKRCTATDSLQGHLWHFAGEDKPWKYPMDVRPEILYWQYLNQTPWSSELIEDMLNAAKNGPYYHRHSKDCIKRLVSRMCNNITDVFNHIIK